MSVECRCVASSATAHLLHHPSEVSKSLSLEGNLRGFSISSVASGNLLFMGLTLIFKSRVFIHGHHIFSMLTSYSQLAWNFLSSFPLFFLPFYVPFCPFCISPYSSSFILHPTFLFFYHLIISHTYIYLLFLIHIFSFLPPLLS